MSIESLLETLNLSDKDGLFSNADLSSHKTDFLPNRIKDSLLKINPNYFFCINNEPLILFFDKPKNLNELQKKIWNFNQSPAIFINNGKEWVVKNGFKLLDDKKELETIVKFNNLSDFDYFEIITGRTWAKYKNCFEQNNRVDYYLLNNIEDVRSVLTNPKQGNLHPKIANFLIGRVIFIRYLIDRKVELNTYGITKKEDFYEMLDNKEKAYNFFQQVRDDFNGNLFPLKYYIDDIEVLEKEKIEVSHLLKIKELLQGGKVYADGSYQPSFFDIYDFSIIPIEFISNVYEKFIGAEKQAGTGAYYTPLFLVDYIQKETVSKYFENNPKEYNCKVLDPACGSGIFLVETLRQIISQYQKNFPEYWKEENYEEYKNTLKQLLTENIFGVDKDENAISVAIFSLYITLLDNLRPISIVGFRFPELIETNFFSNDFFDIKKSFDIELKKHHFQFILGNPPWKTKGHPQEKQLFEKYIEDRKNQENSNLEIIHREIAESFLVRVSDFSFNETAFIVVSKILYKIEKEGTFRNYFLNNFLIRQVAELSSVRHQIFNNSNDSAVAPATILFYRKESDTKKLRGNIVKHISLKPNIFFEVFKLMVIEKYDIKEVAQKFFIDEDWIWKVLVYGNILDYYFIKRLKANYSTIGKEISDKSKFVFGQGLKFKDGNRKIDTTKYSNYKFLGSLKKKQNKKGEWVDEQTNYSNFLRPYYQEKNTLVDWDVREVGYFPEDDRIFTAPCLLITGGITKDFKSVSSILYEDSLFKSSLSAIKILENNDVNRLKAFSSILNSSFFSYYTISTGSSSGIEREETHDEEKWLVPFNENENLIRYYNIVEDFSKKIYNATMNDGFLKNQLEDSIENLNTEVVNLFEPSNQERDLIDYANTVTIPMLKGKSIEKNRVISKIKYKDDLLKKYCGIFIDYFVRRFNSDGHYFEAEVQWSDYLIMIKFKIIPEPSKEKNLIKWFNIDNKKLIINLTKLGFENLSDSLFLQKDIKGFEEDYFYIAKPNQYKSWHSALAHLDLSEFINELHKNNML